MATMMVRYMPMTSTPHASDEHSFASSNEVSQTICGSEKGKKTEEIMSRDEVLIKLQRMVGKRSSLKTLMPTKHVHRDQYALDNETSPDTVMEMYQGIFMGKVEFVRKIFVPISDESVHWYLLVIDIDKSKPILLDSLQTDSRRERRKIQVRKVITTTSRMRLAIDLVLNEYNELRVDVIKRAGKTWKGFQQHRENIMKAIFG
ncbi:Ulp1 protease family, C-terminal catalytic domain [Sesbania bispinosa]|nr:Ulp1 protease family, C-terminal catalytic domain [Sesbania bispinosa]